jgi:hypothetical protein
MGRMCSTWSESGIQFESENGYEVKWMDILKRIINLRCNKR